MKTINAKVMPSFLQKPLFLVLNDLLSNVVMEVQTDINNKMVNPFKRINIGVLKAWCHTHCLRMQIGFIIVDEA